MEGLINKRVSDDELRRETSSQPIPLPLSLSHSISLCLFLSQLNYFNCVESTTSTEDTRF